MVPARSHWGRCSLVYFFMDQKRFLDRLHIDKLHLSGLRVRHCHLSASFICFNGKILHKVREVKVFRESCAALLFMTNINNSAVRPHLSYYGGKLHIQNLLKHHTYHLLSQSEAELRGTDWLWYAFFLFLNLFLSRMCKPAVGKLLNRKIKVETHIRNRVQSVCVDDYRGRTRLLERQRRKGGRGAGGEKRVRLLTQRHPGSVLLSINASQGQACRSLYHQQFNRLPFTGGHQTASLPSTQKIKTQLF